MKKLIMVPGNVSSPFFLNELEIALKYYDKVSIIDFGGKKKLGRKLQSNTELNISNVLLL